MKKILFIIALLFLVGCTSSDNSLTNDITGNVVAYDAPSNVKVTVKLQGSVMDPSEITVKQGSLVLLEIIDLDNATDVFVVNGYNVEEKLVNGEGLFYFKANKKGAFTYGLRTDKRKGTLVVN